MTQRILTLALLLTSITTLAAEPRFVESLLVDEVLLDVAFRSDMEGYALGFESVWKTVDGGMTWERISWPIFHAPFTALGLFGDEGMIIGDRFGGFLVVEGDKLEMVTRSGAPILEIEAVSRDHWVAISDSLIISTIDGGATFRKFNASGQRNPLTALDITDSSLMHVTQSTYGVWRSTDGGTTWNTLNPETSPFGNITDVRFTSRDVGFVGSLYPWNLFSTFDGGETWSTGPFEYPSSIAVLHNGIGAYTANDYMRLSNDGGRTWPDSLFFPGLVVDGALFFWSNPKVVTVGERIYLLVSNEQAQKSAILRVDTPSSVEEEWRIIPKQIDLAARAR